MIALARLLLRLELRRLERGLAGPFDAGLSRRIDAVVAALEALAG
jgi:hypothetical protein